MALRDRIINNIKRFAQRDGQPLSTVGACSGVGQPIMSKFMNGHTHHLSVENLERLAIYFGTDIARLLEPEDHDPPSIEMHQLNMVCEQLPDAGKRVLIQTAKALLEQEK